MVEVAVLVPVLGRPEHISPLLASLRSSERELRLRELFLCSRDDLGTIGTLKSEGAIYLIAPHPPGPGDYGRKMNHGYRWAVAHDFEWVLLAADDVVFHPGWAEAAVRASKGACVVGTNDLGNPEVMAGRHATHSLIHRDYLSCGTIDEDDKILHEGYHHNWVDNELVGTAKARGTFTSARDSHVEHLHWAWGKADMDEIYEVGKKEYHADRVLFERRRKLWES